MKKIYTFLLVLFYVAPSMAQNTGRKTYLYLGNSAGFVGKIDSIPEEGKITFTFNDGLKRTFQRERVILAFNDYGKYLVISDLPENPAEAQTVIEHFYNRLTSLPGNDIIIRAVPLEIIPCIITFEGNAINYRTLEGNSASLNTENVIGVIRKNGSHELFKDVNEAAPILGNNKNKIAQALEKIPANKPEKNRKEESKPVEDLNTTQETATISRGVSDTGSGLPGLSPEEKQFFANQSIDNILIFKDYLNIIGNKSNSTTEKREATRAALELFTPLRVLPSR